MTAKSKDDLRTQNTSLFPDNTVGQIQPVTQRQMIEDLVDSNAALQVARITGSPTVVDVLTDFIAADVGADVVTLPLIDDYVDRNLFLSNRSGADVTVIADVTNPDTIDGEIDIVIVDEGFLILSPDRANNNWVVSLNSGGLFIDFLADVDTSSVAPISGDMLQFDGTNWIPVKQAFRFSTTFSKTGNLATGAFLKSGEVTTSGAAGWLVPQDSIIETVTISRSDVDASDIEILVDGVVEVTVATAATSVVDETMSFAVTSGQALSARNIGTGNTMSDVIVTIFLEGMV